MSKSIQYILVVATILTFGCRPKYTPTPVFTTYNDFENVIGWINNPSNNSHTVTSADAHGGKYSTKIDKNNVYGYYYKIKLKEVSKKPVKWVKITAWCKRVSPKLERSTVVCAIQDDKDVYVKWTEAFLAEFMFSKKDEWVFFEKDFEISATNNPELFFSMFFWTAGKDEEIFIDDMKIQFFD